LRDIKMHLARTHTEWSWIHGWLIRCFLFSGPSWELGCNS
jgi:hypothetical protein